ncbi:hypothetical protein BD310DRAFT_939309 [Dichomitus squalens]|uniref:Uncharacterized protein n=1 Tax=Dichomitus squalens TaxID=114155 RepID=A0A4Q9PH66_9APHY|nr:hypothetical protein BD310DRAFT_939309 [Dichomitus squalens]
MSGYWCSRAIPSNRHSRPPPRSPGVPRLSPRPSPRPVPVGIHRRQDPRLWVVPFHSCRPRQMSSDGIAWQGRTTSDDAVDDSDAFKRSHRRGRRYRRLGSTERNAGGVSPHRTISSGRSWSRVHVFGFDLLLSWPEMSCTIFTPDQDQRETSRARSHPFGHWAF